MFNRLKESQCSCSSMSRRGKVDRGQIKGAEAGGLDLSQTVIKFFFLDLLSMFFVPGTV